MRCRIPSKPQVNQLLDLWPHKIVWVLFQEPDNTMVVSFADAADHGATTLTATADPCMDLESNLANGASRLPHGQFTQFYTENGAFMRKCCARSLAPKLAQLFYGFFCPVCKLLNL